MVNGRQLSRLWHAVLFVVDGAPPAGTGTRVVNLLSFFTIQSNLLMLAGEVAHEGISV